MAFNHKRADFWLPNFGFKRSLLSLLKHISLFVMKLLEKSMVFGIEMIKEKSSQLFLNP